jgi:hypothetical protein
MLYFNSGDDDYEDEDRHRDDDDVAREVASRQNYRGHLREKSDFELLELLAVDCGELELLGVDRQELELLGVDRQTHVLVGLDVLEEFDLDHR